MKITKQGDVEIQNIREIMPIKEDFFLVEFHVVCFSNIYGNIIPMLFGDKTIGIKFWSEKEGNGEPTIVRTPLKWKTFNMDDNILIMIKNPNTAFRSIQILITKKYHR